MFINSFLRGSGDLIQKQYYTKYIKTIPKYIKK